MLESGSDQTTSPTLAPHALGPLNDPVLESGPSQIPSTWLSPHALGLPDDATQELGLDQSPGLGLPDDSTQESGLGQSSGLGTPDNPIQAPGLGQSPGIGLPDEPTQESVSGLSSGHWPPLRDLDLSDSAQESSSDETPETRIHTLQSRGSGRSLVKIKPKSGKTPASRLHLTASVDPKQK